MGSPSPATTNTTQQTKSQPWDQALPAAQGLLGAINGQIGSVGPTATETGAINALEANAGNGNPFAGAIGGLATNMLNGGGATAQAPAVTQGFQDYQKALTPYLSADFLDPTKAPGMSSVLDTIRNDVSNSVNGMFAGAGRDLSGMNTQTLARGIAQGEAQPLLDQYNRNVATQVGAAGSLYGAGNTTSGILSNMTQQGVQNAVAGAGLSDAAIAANNYGPMQQLALEAQRRGIPMDELRSLTGMVVPIANLGNQGSSNGTSTYTPPSPSPLQTALGVGIGAAGILGGMGTGNPMMAMGGASGILGAMNGSNGSSPFGGVTGNYFPGNPAAAGAGIGTMPGYGNYPMFR